MIKILIFSNFCFRHGYNYHNDPSNFIYQMIEIRNQWMDYKYNQSNSKKVKVEDDTNTSNSSTAEKPFYFSSDTNPLTVLTHYQLCDVNLPEVKEMIKNATLADTFSKNFGWLSKEFIDNVRSVMYEYLERAWKRYTSGELSFGDNEQSKLYNDYLEEDKLDSTRQKITRRIENLIQRVNRDENDISVLEHDTVKDKYEDWAVLDREELAKIIFTETHLKTEVSNSNPFTDDEDDVDFKIESLDME